MKRKSKTAFPNPLPNEANGVLYVIEISGEDLTESGHDLVKIGFTRDVVKRLADLRTGIPFDHEVTWQLPMHRSAEKRVHQLLAPHRHAREWYRWTREVEDFFEDMYDYQMLTAMRISCGDNEFALDIQHEIDITEAVMDYEMAVYCDDDAEPYGPWLPEA